jgi:Na+-driven multidrug efflux pump
LPTYEVSPRHYLIASGAGLGVAIATGFAWAFIPLSGYFFYFSLLIGLGVGYAIGEVISRSVNRKRGRGLQAIGGTCMVISYIISNLFHMALFFSLSGLLALALGIIIATIRLR